MVKKIDRKAEKDKRHLRVRKKISGTADCQSRSSQQRHRLPASCFADYVCQSAHQLPESGKRIRTFTVKGGCYSPP